MHHLGLSAAEVAVMLHKEADGWDETLAKFEQAALNNGMPPDQAKRFAMVQYLHQFTTELLEANNQKIAADLIRLGVLQGTIKRGGEPAF